MAAELLTTDLLVNLSILLIVIALVVIAGSAYILSKKTKEEESAAEILKRLRDIKSGKPVVQSKIALTIKPNETSLKDMLKKKFQPKIESQLKTKIHVIDFNAKDENFLALVDISGVKILLTLDSSGKIIDYKKIKAEA